LTVKMAQIPLYSVPPRAANSEAAPLVASNFEAQVAAAFSTLKWPPVLALNNGSTQVLELLAAATCLVALRLPRP
jgi:hypothetical protein